jgi:sugar phosphate isomerase/epimerase
VTQGDGTGATAAGGPLRRPRVGFHVSAFGSHQVLAALAGVSRAGFEGLEIYADTSQIFADRPDEFRTIFGIVGIGFAGVHGGGLLTSAEFRANEMAEWKRLVQWVGEAGGEYAVFYGGESHGDFEADLVSAASFLDELGEFAASHGVRLCYEPDRTCPFSTNVAIARLMETTDPRWVGLSVDTARLALAGLDPTLYVLSQRQRLHVVHVRDLRAAADPDAAVPPYAEIGAGTLDLQGLVAALRATSFGGWIVGVVDDPERSAHDSAVGAAGYFRNVLGLEF